MREHRSKQRASSPWSVLRAAAFASALCVLPIASSPARVGAQQTGIGGRSAGASDTKSTDASGGGSPLEAARLKLGKWIETQQILAKERNDWNQGKEILVGRLDLLKREIAALEEKIAAAQGELAATEAAKAERVAESQELEAVGVELATAVGGIEAKVSELFQTMPAPVQEKLLPLRQRIPADPANTKATLGERFQSVLPVLNEVNKANNEVAVVYEVRTLADGRPAEVRAMYVGLAQAYYVSASGEAGIGTPSPTGWQWQPAPSIAGDVMTALDIVGGKHSPSFVPLPVRLQ